METSSLIQRYFNHFNAGVVKDAADSYISHLLMGGKMMVTLAGAMSTAGIGKQLSQMIKKGAVHMISCTGANLEEDIMRCIAHNSYKRVKDYRNFGENEDWQLVQKGLNRVTDTCIPEEEAFRELEKYLFKVWKEQEGTMNGEFPHILLVKAVQKMMDDGFKFDLDPAEHSWVYNAFQNDVPIYVPGWEDSTTANIFAGYVFKKEIDIRVVKTGIHYMEHLISEYLWQVNQCTNPKYGMGFFQVGGGIAGDFPICVVPLINQDLGDKAKYWSWFCQISSSPTSYGSYSGATPNEKISWGKLLPDDPKFVIESDATIVVPLMFEYILEGLRD